MPTKVALIALAVAATTLAGCESDDKTVSAPPPSAAPVTSPASNGIEALSELLATGGKRYLRPNKQFWVMSTNTRQGTMLARTMGDRWVAGADKDPSFADLFTIGSLDGLFRPREFNIGATFTGLEAPPESNVVDLGKLTG